MWRTYGNRIFGVRKMISLSKEWSKLSKAMYGKRFIDELAKFLRFQRVNNVLECGCGDGYILKGLAERGITGVGVDSDAEMISMAFENQVPGVQFQQMDWRDISKIDEKFDVVMCRGNSLAYVEGWGVDTIDPKKARESILESLSLFNDRARKDGLIYVDTISYDEIEGDVRFTGNGIDVAGKVEYDWENRIRKIYGKGKVGDDIFEGGATGYLLSPKELDGLVRVLKPSKVWVPKLKHEENYHVVCARKR